MGNYEFPINKMILAKLPSQYEPASADGLGKHLITLEILNVLLLTRISYIRPFGS